MTREEAAIRAQSNADVYGRVWYAVTYDGKSYTPTEVLGRAYVDYYSYMLFEPRPLGSILERQQATQRQKGHRR